MKIKLFVFATMLVTAAQAQIGFTDHLVIDNTESVNYPEKTLPTDIDSDGDMDVFVAIHQDGTIVWYENLDGLGNFGPQRMVSTETSYAQSVFSIDINGDGDLDILSASAGDNKIAWYENLDGLGNFGPQIVVSNQEEEAIDVYAGDIDGDGDNDIVAISERPNIDHLVWFENLDGSGNFGTRQIISTKIGWGKEVELKDMDGDSDLDVVQITSSPREISWYENINGQGSFGPQRIIAITSMDPTYALYALYVNDLDGDGDYDVAFADHEKVGWYQNVDGLGNFGADPTIITQKGWLELAGEDVDGDGDIDLIVGHSFSNEDESIEWFENLNGQGQFGPSTYITDDVYWATDLFITDLNGDGTMDLLSSSLPNNMIDWFPNSDGLGNFGEVRHINYTIYLPETVISADLDGDSDNDILVFSHGDKSLVWLKNMDGFGNFEEYKRIIENNTGQESAMLYLPIDIDNDGDIDIAGSAHPFTPTWYENIDGLGNFQKHFIDSTNNSLEFGSSADIDGDGDNDLIYSDRVAQNLILYKNMDGLGTFGPAITIPSTIGGNTSVAIADIDGDGDNDLISASESNNKFDWYENEDGLGNFGPENIISTNTSVPKSIVATDIDGDNDIDILLAEAGGIIRYKNNGFGTFTRYDLQINQESCVFVEDLDGDNDMDIVAVSKNYDRVVWAENIDGFGNFGDSQIIMDNFENPESVYAKDINGDGTPDVLSVSREGGEVLWFENILFNNRISGHLRANLDLNDCDENDSPVSRMLVVSTDGNNSYGTFTQQNGGYILYVGEGNFTTQVASSYPYYYECNPSSQNSVFNGLGNTDTAEFCLDPTQSLNDLKIKLYPGDKPRPGYTARYTMIFKNVGTTVLSGTTKIIYDDSKLTFNMSDVPPVSSTQNSLTFDYENLYPFEIRTIYMQFDVAPPPITQAGDVLTFSGEITPIIGDETEEDNVFNFEQTVVDSFDPNDIQVLEGESIFIDEIDNYLHYIIRFQNTGTAPAINIRVTNELDPNLDWNTMQIENISHHNRVEITDGNQVEFIFNSINLPDSTTDEENSHGYIAYKIKPKNSTEIGDFFQNSAAIYFDFNPPVITNTVTTTVIEPLGVEENSKNSVALYPVPTSNTVNIKSTLPIVDAKVFNNLGQLLFTVENFKGIEEINVELLSSGIYFAKLTDLEENTYTRKFIKQE